MINIDGLITGLDTASIIDGLLQIQQRQIDNFSARRSTVLAKKASFAGVESRLLSFRGALTKLTSIQTTALNNKVVRSSNEEIVQAAASDDAVAGTYQLQVNALATVHQIASGGFGDSEAALGTGSLFIQKNDGSSATIEINEQNNTLRGLADAINDADAGVTASVINDGSDGTPFRLLVASHDTGTTSEFSITGTLSGGDSVAFDQIVQQAQNAEVSFGSGAGAITISSNSNKLNNVIEGVTLDLRSADAGATVTLNVESDVDGGVSAVQEFVDAYNDFINYVNQQTSYDAELQRGGALLGERAVTSIENELQLAVSSIVGNLHSGMNRLTALGASLADDGTLTLDESKLKAVLSGQVEGVTAQDAARLLALGADSTNSKISFIVGSVRTAEGTVQVDVTSAAEQASITAANSPAVMTTIDQTNDTFSLVVDGKASGEIKLAHGDYTPEELAAELESKINADSQLAGRDVQVSIDGGSLVVSSLKYGSASEVKLLSGTAFAALGFLGTESDLGQDVSGVFIVNGREEPAVGRGTVLQGDENNEFTADLQVRVTLDSSEIVDGPDSTLTVTRGLASRIDKLIGELTDAENGQIKTVNQRYEDIDASIQKSIDRLNSQFDAQRQRLIAQFSALESAVNDLQTSASFITSQLAGFARLG